ncbi:translesion DNA synthesis-associated protein ImuA [Hydrogenophaga sp. MI9]|uniref:translesion DNA synthesis-associated protein ImuA n=1 Tax=Hydrogenophaga sp. MI9 TaxID=3453719 RepID=UPI003EEC9F50
MSVLPLRLSGDLPEVSASAAVAGRLPRETMPQALPRAVAEAIWRGDQLGRPVMATLPSGFEALDAALPGGGWPCQGLTEILSTQGGTLEWRLLGPALARVCAAGRSVVLVGPPQPPHLPGLRFEGVTEQQLVWVQAETPAERLWATEQLLKGRSCGALIAWLPKARPEQLRRLQVLAGAGDAPVFLCRPAEEASSASAAPLRLLVRVEADWCLAVEVFKRKGPPLEAPLHLQAMPAALHAILTPRLRQPSRLLPRDPARAPAPVPTAPAFHESDHALVSAAAATARRQRLAH